jgi:hypothetical protein
VLVAGRSVANERDVGDVDAEEVKVRLLWTPSEHGDRFAVTGSGDRIVDGYCTAPHLHFTLVAVTGGRDAVDQDPVVAQ